jgi:hypothetical protein
MAEGKTVSYNFQRAAGGSGESNPPIWCTSAYETLSNFKNRELTLIIEYIY